MSQRIPLSRIIPMNPDALGYGRQPITNTNTNANTNTNTNSYPNQSNVNISYKPSYNYQNVIIGNGMMTVRTTAQVSNSNTN